MVLLRRCRRRADGRHAHAALGRHPADDDRPRATRLRSAPTSQAAASAGVTVELDLYPLHSQAFTGGQRCAPSANPQACGNSAKIAAFAAWTAQVAQAFPTRARVHRHERVQPAALPQPAVEHRRAEPVGRDLRPRARRRLRRAQGRRSAATSSGASGSRRAATTTRTRRATRRPRRCTSSRTSAPGSRRSPRDAPHGAADGRPRLPSLPDPAVAAVRAATRDPNDASVANLPRIYQAFYNGFNGSPQPTIGQQAGGGLPVSLNEVGIQTAETGVAGYTGTEVSANGGRRGARRDCDPGLPGDLVPRDARPARLRPERPHRQHLPPDRRARPRRLAERPLPGRATTPAPKLSAAAVQQWIAESGGNCQGSMNPWHPAGVAATTRKGGPRKPS